MCNHNPGGTCRKSAFITQNLVLVHKKGNFDSNISKSVKFLCNI